MSATVKEKAKIYNLPVGRLINQSLFERDAYKRDEASAPGKPMYKVELAFEPKDVTGEGTIEDALADAIAATWGEAAANDWLAGKRGYGTPLLEGDVLHAARLAKGKEGDAYKGKIVIRANTSFNKDGVEGPGGIAVYGPDTSPITANNQSEIYQGCFGIAAVTISTYEAANHDKCVKFYLVAFQKTAEGTRLATATDRSGLFKPVAGAPGSADAGVRRRRPG